MGMYDLIDIVSKGSLVPKVNDAQGLVTKASLACLFIYKLIYTFIASLAYK